MDIATQKRFINIFKENISRRSRTAHGQDKGGETSSKKKPLLLKGKVLRAKVAENTEHLITDIISLIPWNRAFGENQAATAAKIREMCEHWFDITMRGLYDPEDYATEFNTLEANAERVSKVLGWVPRLNHRYRLWTPSYTTLSIGPILLEKYMDEFYTRLAEMISYERDVSYESDVGTNAEEQEAHIMAYADVMMDGELHPWIDGCSRVSTALVMWIAGLSMRFAIYPPPLFAPTKQEHYASIRDLNQHVKYYLQAKARGCSRY